MLCCDINDGSICLCLCSVTTWVQTRANLVLQIRCYTMSWCIISGATTIGVGLWAKSCWPAFENEIHSARLSAVLGLGGSGLWWAESRGGLGKLMSNGWSCSWPRPCLAKRTLSRAERVVSSSKRWSPALFKLIEILDIIATLSKVVQLSVFALSLDELEHKQLLWQKEAGARCFSSKIFRYRLSN